MMRLLIGVLFGWLVLAGVSEAACTGSGLVWSCPAGTTTTEVQTMINDAGFLDGATATFAAGTYSWGGSFRFANAKGTTLACASEHACVVTITQGGVCCSDGDLSGDNNKLYRISGFLFQNAPASTNVFIFYGTSGTIMRQIRMDHNWFKDFGTDTIIAVYGGVLPNSQAFGLFDHNTVTSANNAVVVKVLGIGIDATTTTWNALYSSSVRGTINNVFVEDNFISYSALNNFGAGILDAWSGASLVARFNYFRNGQVVTHGTEHSGGPPNFEAYGNIIERDTGSPAGNERRCFRCIYHQGSMESYWWGNRLIHAEDPIRSDAMAISHYRSADPTEAGVSDPPGRCDGTKAWDGNTSGLSGYPCWLQPGRAMAGGSSPGPRWGTLAPVYVWNNVDTSTSGKVDVTISDNWTGPPYPSTHIVANRDYYNAVSASAQSSATSPFDGTTGMGFGTLANRPTTCTHTTSPDGDEGGGVGYWATDQGSWNTSTSNPYGVQQNGADGVLYRCSATNTWTVHYTPYTYPHPLNTGGGSSPGKFRPNLNIRHAEAEHFVFQTTHR